MSTSNSNQLNRAGVIVPLQRFTPNDILTRNAGTALEQEMVYVKGDAAGHILRDRKDPTIIETLSHQDMMQLTLSPGYRYRPGGATLAAAEIKARTGAQRLDQLSSRKAKRAQSRFPWVIGFKQREEKGEASRSAPSVARALDDMEQEFKNNGTEAAEKPSVRNFYRWLKMFDKHQNIVVLCGKYVQIFGPKRLEPAVQKIVDDHIDKFMKAERLGYEASHNDLKDEVARVNLERIADGIKPISAPGYKKYRALIDEQTQFALDATREGPGKARRGYLMVTTGIEALEIGSVCQMDAWEIPLFTIYEAIGLLPLLSQKQIKILKATRWIACVIVDVATGIRLALCIAPVENTELALAALEMAMSDKKIYSDAAGAATPWHHRCGIRTLYCDQGSAFISTRFRYAVAVLGIDILHPPARMPWLRGVVERSFRAIHTGLLVRFSGRTFENPIAKGEYDAEALASLKPEEMNNALVRYTVDVDHNKTQKRKFGETKDNRWNRLAATTGIWPLPDRETLRLGCGILMEITLDNRGVVFLNLNYNSTALHHHFCDIGPKKKVKVKISRNDLGAVSVEIGDGNWITVPCMQPGMDNVSVTEWIATAAQLRARFGAQAKISDAIRLQAIRDLRLLGEAAILRSIGAPLITAKQIEALEDSLRFGCQTGGMPQTRPSDDVLDSQPAATPPLLTGPAAPNLPTLPVPDAPQKDENEERKPSWDQGDDVDNDFGMDD